MTSRLTLDHSLEVDVRTAPLLDPLQGMAVVLPFAPSSASLARRGLQQWLRAAELDRFEADEVLDDALLVVSELVGNSVRHARPLEDGNLLVRWWSDATGVVVSVTDGGAVTDPEKRSPGPEQATGRGLEIVDALASLWWHERTRRSSTVNAVLAPPAPAQVTAH